MIKNSLTRRQKYATTNRPGKTTSKAQPIEHDRSMGAPQRDSFVAFLKQKVTSSCQKVSLPACFVYPTDAVEFPVSLGCSCVEVSSSLLADDDADHGATIGPNLLSYPPNCSSSFRRFSMPEIQKRFPASFAGPSAVSKPSRSGDSIAFFLYMYLAEDIILESLTSGLEI